VADVCPYKPKTKAPDEGASARGARP
jgi:hypothetical protein